MRYAFDFHLTDGQSMGFLLALLPCCRRCWLDGFLGAESIGLSFVFTQFIGCIVFVGFSQVEQATVNMISLFYC